MEDHELHDMEAEQMTLGAMLKDNGAAETIFTLLNHEDFSHNYHRELFKIAKELHNENRFDFNTLRQWLKEKDRFPSVGGIEYFGNLRHSVPTVLLVKHYADKVRSMAIRSRALQLSEDIKDMTINGDYATIDDFVTALNMKFNTLEINKKGKLVHISITIKNYIKNKLNGIIVKSPLTGFCDLDSWMRGIGRNRLIIVAGRPGTGKTSFATKVARVVSKQDYGPVPIFSCEMEQEELIDRMTSDISGIPFQNIQSGDLTEKQRQIVEETGENIKHYNLLIDDTPRMDVPYIAAQCRKLKREHGSIGMIAVDYLGLLDINQGKNENKSDAIGRATKEFKLLAKELQCSIMVLVQMNREVEKRSTKRPVMSDLKDSGSIEQDADMVIFLSKDDTKSTANKSHIDLIVAKGRQNGVNDFELSFYGSIQRMETKML